VLGVDLVRGDTVSRITGQSESGERKPGKNLSGGTPGR
jgi:hypothetical protein